MTHPFQKPELLAPVGSFESLQAAIKSGANSIYFGVEQLNMRARSSNNFTLDDLETITKIARSKGVKTYLTLNTVMYDHDISLMKQIVKRAKECKVTAVIAADQAVMNYAKTIQMPLHLSTQVNVSNFESVCFYANFADCIVLARELTLMQVREITRQIKRENILGPSGQPIKIEVFAHGALCMAVSGKCYLSLHSHNASANRGACIQNCRRTYTVKDKEEDIEFEIDNEYIMSAKDLCTIDFLDKLVEAGISVYKIEGRGRSADYVAVTVACYREAIDSIQAGDYTPEKIQQWKSRLATVFNRGFWDGYYLGKKMGEWSDEAGSKATQKKIYIGKGIRYFPRKKVAEFSLESHNLSKGDTILITGPSTGAIQSQITELRVNDHTVDRVTKGELFSFPVEEKIRAQDKLYKIVPA